jgi:hypothetical protein
MQLRQRDIGLKETVWGAQSVRAGAIAKVGDAISQGYRPASVTFSDRLSGMVTINVDLDGTILCENVAMSNRAVLEAKLVGVASQGDQPEVHLRPEHAGLVQVRCGRDGIGPTLGCDQDWHGRQKQQFQ